MASLLLLSGPRKGLRLDLPGDRNVLGREGACDVVISDALLGGHGGSKIDSVSRRHAIITQDRGTYSIEDGNGRGDKSRNGTYVNDKKISFPDRVTLHDGDRIRICDFTFSFDEEAETAFTVVASVDHDSSIHSLQARTADQLRIILEISNSLSNTLDIDALLPQIVENLFGLFKHADRGFILVTDETSGAPTVRAFKSRRDGEDADTRYTSSIVRRCLEKREAILGNDLPRQFPDSGSVNDLSIRSLMCAPLWSQDGKPLGAILLDARGPKTKFVQEDLNLLLGVASQASIALTNTRLHRDSLALQRREQDLEVAHQVQHALLPQRLPNIPGYEFYAYYESAQQIGGDYYAFIPLPGQRLAVLLGDVAGKGVAGALVMARFSVEARVCLETEPDLASALGKLNTLMTRAGVSDRFVTLVGVVLDPATHSATLVNAGHPSPLLVRHATGKLEEAAPIRVAGLPIGVAEDHVYESCEIQLLQGDSLVLFSDGVPDALNAQERRFRVEGVRTVLESGKCSPREAGERLLQAVKHHGCGCSQNDDITLVCFGRTDS
jgi:serine phosphatase RsbU (regulator of sigma subunit)